MAILEPLCTQLIILVSLRTCLVFILVLLITFAVFQNHRSKRRQKLPPGPWGFPILGCLPLLGSKPHVVMDNWARKYGAVYSVNFGVVPVVILNGWDAIKEALVKQGADFAGRPDLFTFRTPPHRGLNYKGILTENYNQRLQERRWYTMRCLRDVGAGKSLLETSVINANLESFVSSLINTCGEPTDILPLLSVPIANVILKLTFGFNSDRDNSQIAVLLDDVKKMFELHEKLSVVNFVPFMENLPISILQDFDAHSTHLVKEIITWCNGHETEHGCTQNDSVLNIYKRNTEIYHRQNSKDIPTAHQEEKTSTTAKKNASPTIASRQIVNDTSIFSDNQAISVAIDLFIGGTETITTTLQWLFLYMAVYPEVQRKVQEEIDSNIGDNTPTITNRVILPYAVVTIMEVQRLSPALPLGVPRMTTADVHFRGFLIPKGTMVIANLWSAMNDPSHWHQPEKFNPQRHLDACGKVVKNDAFVPFSSGKRSCIGEVLANMELFLFFTSLMQKFTFCLSDDTPATILEEGIFKTSYRPPAHRLRVVDRRPRR